MVETVAPTRSRRLPFWAILVALVVCVLGGVFVVLWIKLPTWAPEWVVEHSPWVDPILRAVEVDNPRGVFNVARIKQSAKQRLLSWGPAAIPGLVAGMEVRSLAGRDLALDILDEVGDDRLIIPLLHLLRQEAESLEQRQVAGEVGVMGNARRFNAIQEALRHQRNSALADAFLPFPTTADLASVVMLELAGKISDERMIPALREVLWEDERPSSPLVSNVYGSRGVVAATSLVQSPQASAISTLLPAFSDPSVMVRRRAVFAVAGLCQVMTDERLGDVMRQRLVDDDADVRRAAAEAMAWMDVPGAEDDLISLSHHPNAEERNAAIYGLGTARATQRGIDRLGECLADDTDERVRSRTVEALVRTGDSKALALLLRAMERGTPHIRREICFGLSRTKWMKETQVQEAFLAAIDDPDDPTSEWAERALSRLKLEPDLKQRVEAAIERLKPRREQRKRVHEEP